MFFNDTHPSLVTAHKDRLASRLYRPEVRQSSALQLDKVTRGAGVSYITLAVVAGAIVGWILGLVQIVYVASPTLTLSPLMPAIPIFSALGWSLYGLIVGGGFSEKNQ